VIIVFSPEASRRQKNAVLARIQDQDLEAHLLEDEHRSIVALVGESQPAEPLEYERWPGVERVIVNLQPFLLAIREYRGRNSLIPVGATGNGSAKAHAGSLRKAAPTGRSRPATPGRKSGPLTKPQGPEPVVSGGEQVLAICGPCAVEFEETTLEIARAVKASGCRLFRGGAFKPRTSPYSFQGLGDEGLRILARVREETGLLIVTEVLESPDLEKVAAVADVIQIGTRNMSNFNLLKRLGGIKKPVLLKRGMSSTIHEFLMAAEYILANGNPNVILCERGIRTFETYTRFNLDISAVPAIKQLSHLPIIVDPSHATGRWELVEAVALAGIAAGADGIMVEIHSDPINAFSDGAQALKPGRLAPLLEKARGIAAVLGRRLT
jgi:3-deoxy-7-phosphoheptulonate synthase